MLILCLTSVNELNDAGNSTINSELLEGYIAQIANGDAHALELLYNSARGAIYAYSLSVLKNTHDAEDVLHDCMISVFSSAAGYAPYGKPMAWLLTISKNLCLAKLRNRKRTQLVMPEEWDFEYSSNSTQGNQITAFEDREVIAACMNCLSDTERSIITLHAVAGFKHREIADFMGLPLSTTLSKYSRATKKLKQQLERHYYHSNSSIELIPKGECNQ